MLLLAIFGYSQKNIDKVFEYPIKPGTEAWGRYSSTLDRIKVLQIPETTLHTLTTDTLLNICLDYPFLIEICLDNNYQKNFEIIASQFNGLKELLNRPDFVSALFSMNDNLMKQAIEYTSKLNGEREKYIFDCFVVEFLLTQDNVINNAVFNNLLPELFNNNLKTRLSNESVFEPINDVPYMMMINKGILLPTISFATLGSYYPATIFTPNNNSVPCQKWSGTDIGSGDYMYNMAMVVFNQHSATLVEYPSMKYNCHGYAWHYYYHYGVDSEKVWINSPYQGYFVNDGSFIAVQEAIGDVVSYYGDHSARRLSNNTYKSKWGNGVLATHAPNDVPSIYLNGSTSKTFYVKKPYTSFSGPSFAQPSATYEIVGLQSGYTVEWSLSDSFYNQYCIQKNYPASNKCVITAHSTREMIDATLVATIKKNGYFVTSLQKNVSSYTGFKGTYTQIPESNNKYNFPTILNSTINDLEIGINPACNITINSKNFLHKTLTSSNSSITLIPQAESVGFYVPYNSGISHFTITTSGSQGGNNYSILVNVLTSPLPSLSIDYIGDEILLSLVDDENPMRSVKSIENNEPIIWNLEVINAITGKTVYSGEQTDLQMSINTSQWSPGVYIIRVTIGKDVITKKLYISEKN